MLLSNEDSLLLFQKVLDISASTALEAKKYIQENKVYGITFKYPEEYTLFTKDDPEYAHYFNEIPVLIYEVPRYILSDFPKDKIDYTGVFFSFPNSNFVDCSKLEGFNDLIEFVELHQPFKTILTEKDDRESVIFFLRLMIDQIVERFLFLLGTDIIKEDSIKEIIKPYVIEKLNRFLNEQLRIKILIPLSLITFEENSIELSDSIQIIRIPDGVQRSRVEACKYEAVKEDMIASCATHMIVIHDYYISNINKIDLNQATRNHVAYPIDIIDRIIAAIRIVTGYLTGYTQILAKPIGWIDSFYADLEPLYGARINKFNPQSAKENWFNLKIDMVSKSQSAEIQKVYSAINANIENKSFQKVLFSLRRLNRCMLREETDDTAIDAIIGLETLLAGGTLGEITYTISNRIPVVFSKLKELEYTPHNSRNFMRKIYAYRSAVVHGRKIKEKEEYIELGTKKIHVKDVSIDFLRYALLFVIKNIQYLDEKLFDIEIDNILELSSEQ